MKIGLAFIIGTISIFGGFVAPPVSAAELLPDGSFENFDDTWACDLNCGNATDYIILSENAVEGIWYAYLFHEAGIYQNLTIPADAATLHLWFDNQPDEAVPEAGAFTVSLTDVATGEVYVTETFATASDTWIEGTLTIPTSAQGQTVQLLLSNATGFNRIDFLEFQTTADAITELQETYATVKLRVLSAQDQAVKGAKVFVKYNGERVDLLNLTTGNAALKVKTNAKGLTPQFIITETLAEGDSFKICARKKHVTECAAIQPETGVATSYDFSFTNKKVK